MDTDDDIVIIEDSIDVPREPPPDEVVITDFSQVRIEVHAGYVAEKILESLRDEINPDYGECPESEVIDIDEETDDIIKPNPADCVKPDECDNNAQVCDIIDLEENGITQEYVDDGIQETEETQEDGDDIQIIPDGEPEDIPDEETEEISEPIHEIPNNMLPEEMQQQMPDKEQRFSEEGQEMNANIKKSLVISCMTDITDTEDNTGGYVDDSPKHNNDEQMIDQDFHCTDYVMIKEEPEQFEGTDFTDFEAPIETYNDDLPPEDIYHYKNKIILGSKPSPDINVKVKQEHAIVENNLDAFVSLENLGYNLRQNPCFCKDCDILFATPNALDAHNMSIHSLLVAVSKNVALKSTAKPAFARKSTGAIVKIPKNQARKSTGSVTSQLCRHCNKVFPIYTDLIKHLYDLVALKKFSCDKCEAVFKTQVELVAHATVHVKAEKIKVKKENLEPVTENSTHVKKKILYEEDVKKKLVLSPKKEVCLIPSSSIFQCENCSLHFVSPWPCWLHTSGCTLRSSYGTKVVVCKICKKKFRDIDIQMHLKQHSVPNKFKVYKLTRLLMNRMLCECPQCGVCFNERSIKPHLKNCGRLVVTRCDRCRITVPSSQAAKHQDRHVSDSLKPKDFIIIKHFIPTKKRAQKAANSAAKKIKLETSSKKVKVASDIADRKIKKEPMDSSVSSKIKMINRLKFEKGKKFRVYFCKHCRGCCVKDNNPVHLSQRCLTKKKLSENIICDECGLQLNKKTIMSHKRLHHTKNLTINDIVFYEIGTLKRVVPSMPKYPQCKICKIIFFDKNIMKEHICAENYKTCNVCGEKLDHSAYDAHMQFHRFIQNKPKRSERMIPELMEKYKSLNTSWNIMYSCNRCEVVTDLYDRAIEHSQRHAPAKNTIKCYICNLKFQESCWSRHSDLHTKNDRMPIGTKDLKVLPYDPQKLLKEEWFELFEGLPESQIREITDRSIYGYERGIGMKLQRAGRSDLTLYCCSNCNSCCHNNEISKHMNTPCKGPGHACNICDIKFMDICSLKFHEILHSRNTKKEDFRIVKFVKENNFAKKNKVLNKNKVSKENKVVEENNSSTHKYDLYKCTQCDTCLRREVNLAKHNCIASSRKVYCNKCKQMFNLSSMHLHRQEHLNKPDFGYKNIKVSYFNPTRRVDEEDEPEKPVRKRKAETKKVKKQNIEMPKSKSESPKIAKVYKCDCGLHYTSLKTIENHKHICSGGVEISRENCSKCGLLFPTDVLVSHLCKHHSNDTTITVELYNPEHSPTSVESTSESPTTSNTGNKDMVKLYKCSECNVYFLMQNTCYKHVRKSHVRMSPLKYIQCKFCGLQFTINTLQNHFTKHHETDFDLDNVLVVEYHPSIGKRPPKINIYKLSEKLQSGLVTSSVDES